MNPTIFKNYRQWLLDQPMPKGKRSVLLAGLELFAQQGFNGTSTAQIADKAGVSQATIFKYFKTKQDLLLSILQPIIENFFPLYRDDFLDSLSQFKTLQELIHFIVRNRYQFLKDNADAVLIFTTEMLTNDTVRELFTNIIKKSLPIIYSKLIMKIKKFNLRTELDFPIVFRTIISQTLAYFFQRQFISTLPVDENHDLQLIEDQILRSVGA